MIGPVLLRILYTHMYIRMCRFTASGSVEYRIRWVFRMAKRPRELMEELMAHVAHLCVWCMDVIIYCKSIVVLHALWIAEVLVAIKHVSNFLQGRPQKISWRQIVVPQKVSKAEIAKTMAASTKTAMAHLKAWCHHMVHHQKDRFPWCSPSLGRAPVP